MINYAVRHEEEPLYVDLDVSNGNLMFPGVVCASTIDKVIDVNEGASTAGALCYFFGHVNYSENEKQFRILASKLGKVVQQRLAVDQSMSASGTFIVCPHFPDSSQIGLLKLIKDSFQADTVIISGNERLHALISKEINDCNVLKSPFPFGYVNNDVHFRRSKQMRKIREYFYGSMNDLCPYSISLSFKEFTIKKVGEGFLAPSSALPIGATRKVDETRMVTVEPNNGLLGSILAVSSTENDQQGLLLESSCIGFLWVTEVDEAKSKMVVLSPLPSKPSKNFFLVGTIKWVDQN